MDMVRKANYPEHCSLDEARKILLSEFEALEPAVKRIEPDRALGARLATDVVSARNVPHYTASAVDGYALNAADTAGATPATPLLLENIGGVRFAWVNTGMPTGQWDSVIMVEDTSIDDLGRLGVFRSLTQGENVRAVGEDVMGGQILAYRGDLVTPALVSLLLCAGIETIEIEVRPKTLFIPTGNEIVEKSYWLSEKKIPVGRVVDSNSEYASSLFAEWGYPIDVSPVLPDDPEKLKQAVLDGVDKYDVVIVSAGSAKGRRDHSADIFNELGNMLFRYVRMKPGRPAMAANIKGKPVICSPGFPMSCTVTLWSLVYPLLTRLSGERGGADYLSDAMGSRESLAANLLVQHSSPQGMAEWLRVKLVELNDRTLCWPLSAGASVLWALAECDGVALLPEGALELEKGSAVTVRMMKKPDLKRRLLFQGSDDPAVSLLVSYVRKAGGDFAVRAVGSMGGLAALGRGEAHFAAAHLLDPEDGSYNTSYIEKFAAGRNWRRRLVFYREQGLIVAVGNPKGIKGVGDLVNSDAVFENRQPGAGTRVLLDYLLKENGYRASGIKGYERQSITHMEAANKVASGVADATLGIKAAADALGLEFIPIAHEPYELVFAEDFDDHSSAATIFEALDNAEWRNSVSRMGGYEWPK